MNHLGNLLLAGGMTALIMALVGAVCTIWGVFNLLHPPQKRNRILHLLISTTPAFLGLWVFFRMFSSYLVIADSTVAPTRAEYELVMSRAVGLGSLSILCTLIPIGLAISGMIGTRSATGL